MPVTVHDRDTAKTVTAHYLGVAPMHYLGRWRLQLAARQLERPGVSIARVAEDAGYESEAAFNRAFKRMMGAPPGVWRKSRSTPNGSASPPS